VRQSALEQVLERAHDVRRLWQRLHAHEQLAGAALDSDGDGRVSREQARSQQHRELAHPLVHDAAELRELPERPVALKHEAERARVRQVQECQRIVPRRLQHVRETPERARGQLLLEPEQRQRRVARVEGSLAARSREEQRVARQCVAAHVVHAAVRVCARVVLIIPAAQQPVPHAPEAPRQVRAAAEDVDHVRARAQRGVELLARHNARQRELHHALGRRVQAEVVEVQRELHLVLEVLLRARVERPLQRAARAHAAVARLVAHARVLSLLALH
jgi:hypothetical protein